MSLLDVPRASWALHARDAATDDAEPVESQCCLAHDVSIDAQHGTERTLSAELDGPFCHRALWMSCEVAMEPQSTAAVAPLGVFLSFPP